MNKVYPYLIFGIIITSVLVEIQKSEIEAIQKDNVIISFSFDDNFKTHITALNEMQKYGYKGTVGIIVGTLRAKQNNTLTFEDIGRIKSGGWEIASHSMSHKQMSKISEKKEIEYELNESKIFFQENNINVTTFIYPAGMINENVTRIAKKYYSIGRATCYDSRKNTLIYIKGSSFNELEKNCINSENISNLQIKSIGLNENLYSSEWFRSLLDSSVKSGKHIWLDFHFHMIEENVTNQGLQLSVNNFENILEIVNSYNMNVYTVNDAYNKFTDKK
jgi:Polysaccharide deacetylase